MSESNARYSHRWGFKDTEFQIVENNEVMLTGNRYNLCGYTIPGLLPYVQEMLGFTLDPNETQQEKASKEVATPHRNEAFISAIEEAFDEKLFTFEDQQRLIHSHGQTSADEIYKVLYSSLGRVVDMVLYPQEQKDVETIIALANTHNVCLVPYGGGTNVSGALVCPKEEKRMIVSVDMRAMCKVLWVDEKNYTAAIEAGISGKQLEEELAKRGLTMGHEPDSLEFSTLGGWISTNASGMKKNRYGNIEDIVLDVTMVTPSGVIEKETATPRNSLGMQAQLMLFGSEGNLGIITKAIVKIHRLPQQKKYGSIVFPDFQKGVDFLYHLRHHGVLPSSIRLVDNVQFLFGQALKPHPTFVKGIKNKFKKFLLGSILGYNFKEISACTIVLEGSAEEVKYQQKIIFKIAKQFKGLSGGSENGQSGYMLTFAIAYIRDFLSKYHVIAETFETSIPWEKIVSCCEAVKKKAAEKHQEYNLPGNPYVSYRVTQTYHTGACIYFIYAFYHKDIEKPEKIFHEIEQELRTTILEHGGSLSHHHGIGKIRQQFMPKVLSPASIDTLRKLKQSIDPKNIFGISNNVCSHVESV